MVPKFAWRGYSNDVNLNNGFITIQDVQFEIVGVLDHVGSSNQDGHWLTWAKLDSRWFNCNDTPALATCQPQCECPETIPPSPSIIHMSDEELGCPKNFCQGILHIRQNFRGVCKSIKNDIF